MHEDNASRFKVDQVFKQGVFVAREGNAGYSTGNHVHMEVAKGRLNDVKLGDVKI